MAAFSRAITNTLATDIAEETFAQILDGLPTAHVALDAGSDPLPDQHPLFHAHEELCPGFLEKIRELRRQFDPETLQLEATVRSLSPTLAHGVSLLIAMSKKLISDFRSASPGSQAFNTRLVELTAVAIHDIAVQVFNLGLGAHADDGMATWVPPEDDIYWDFYDGPWPTLFRHHWYADYDQYPSGVADGVGFWAEARIFGGVILFDRRGDEGQPDSIWFHSDHRDVTYRIYQLLDDQKIKLLEFLASDTPDLELLPIHGNESNATREDPEEPIENTGIFRHRWERKALGPDAVDGRLRDVWHPFDYPRRSDLDRAQDRAMERKYPPHER